MKRKIILSILFFVTTWTIPLPGKEIPAPQMADILMKAHNENRKIPVLSIQFPDLDALQVTLQKDGEEINRGKGTDALSGQWKAALWLVNTIVNQGWEIEPGHIIITGALGRMVPGKPGHYIVHYGSLGTISFEIN